MKYYVYYNPIKDILGLSTDKKTFQFSDAEHIFYVITKDYVLIDQIEIEKGIDRRLIADGSVIKNIPTASTDPITKDQVDQNSSDDDIPVGHYC